MQLQINQKQLYYHIINKLKKDNMFEDRAIICTAGNLAELVCTYIDCPSNLFVCSKQCSCFKGHQAKCSLKNIRELSNGIQTVLKRNFCKTYKGEGIEIVARVAKQTYKSPRNYRFCLTECKVDAKKDMQFMVRTLKGCVGVGILHKPTILANNFQYLPDGDYINHGGYMILSNGYQYSHSNPIENFIDYEKIKLQEGSKIRLHLQGNKLIFEQNYQTICLDIPEEMLAKKQLYYGVYLYEEGDQMEVLVKK